tara:strand:+ start:1029 stop:1421 length:393 start_codon:yes stop_codon:yes gene_type:complete
MVGLRYVLWLLLGATAAYGIHLGVLGFLERNLFEYQITLAYLANTITALIITLGLLNAPERFRNSLGFLFMGGSFLKFAVFFIFFYPAYKEDGEIGKQEFSTFFIPYAVCLFFETKALIHRLSQLDKEGK